MIGSHLMLRRYGSDLLFVMVCLICVSGLAFVGFAHARSTQLDLDTAATGLYPPEQFSDQAGSYHWTNGNATLDLPNPGGPVVLALELAGGPQRTVPAEIGTNRSTIAFDIAPMLRRYHILLRSNAAPRFSVVLHSATFVEPAGTRTLGVVLSAAQASGSSVVGSTLLAVLAASAALYGIARLLAYPPIIAAAIGLAAGAIPGLWAEQSWLTAPLLPLLWPGALILALSATAEWQSHRYTVWLAHSRTALAIVTLMALLLGVRYFSFIDRYAVNLLFSDEWDFMNPLFRGQGLLDMFMYKHGPHRQGLGGVVLALVAWTSSWNSRTFGFSVGIIMLLAMLAALGLKRRLSGRWSTSDIVIPLLYLSTVQYGVTIVVPNPAHGALPALLAPLVPLAWTLTQPWQRYSAIVVLTFLMIFTGFGLFMGLIIPVLLLLEIVWERRTWAWCWPAGAFIATLASWALFSVNYTFTTTSSCHLFEYPRPLDYPVFIALMFSRMAGFDVALDRVVVGAIAVVTMLACVAAFTTSALRLVQAGTSAKPLNRTVVILIGFSLIFAVNTALGRICLDLTGGQASRYVPLMTPAFLGLYLWLDGGWRMPDVNQQASGASTALSAFKQRLPIVRRIALLVLIMLLLPLPLPIPSDDAADARGFADIKHRWSACYRTNRSIEYCNAFAGMAMYPVPNAIQSKLDFLEAHGLNLFAALR